MKAKQTTTTPEIFCNLLKCFYFPRLAENKVNVNGLETYLLYVNVTELETRKIHFFFEKPMFDEHHEQRWYRLQCNWVSLSSLCVCIFSPVHLLCPFVAKNNDINECFHVVDRRIR